MGITIKEAHEIISRPLYMKNTPQEIIDAHRVAIECMRKCQEIKQIIHDSPYIGAITAKKIQKVIEDETIDNVRGNRATELLEHTSALSTKEEVIATLAELQLEITELPVHVVNNMNPIIRMEIAPSAEDARELIQQKINELKAESEVEE